MVLVTSLTFVACNGPKKDAKIASLDNKVDKKISMEYPDGFQVSDAIFQGSMSSYCVSKEYSGDEYSFGLKFGKVQSSIENIDKFLGYYKYGTIVENKKVAGKKSLIYQSYRGPLQVIIPYDDKHYACVEFKIKGLSNDDDIDEVKKAYKDLYENEDINKMIDSIKLEKFKKSEKPIKNDYYSIAPVGKWFLESNDEEAGSVVMANNELDDFEVSVDVDVNSFTLDEFESFYGQNAEKSEIKIGDNDYTMYKETSFNSTYLVKESKDNKLVVIQVKRVPVDQAKDLLETIKIK